MKTEINFFSGTSGLVLSIPKSAYPPEYQNKSRLTYYGSLFNSVEINSSFYKIPQALTVAKWSDSVGDDFQFTFKLSKDITHAKDLDYSEKDLGHFLQTISNVEAKKGCLLIQFPPKLSVEKIDQVKLLIRKINGHKDWRVAIEFRNVSWYQKVVYDFVNQYRATIVLHDLPGSSPPLLIPTGDFIYLRFHGPGGKYRGSYTDDFLNASAKRIKRWLDEDKKVYVYFNNTMGDAFNNLKRLNELVDI